MPRRTLRSTTTSLAGATLCSAVLATVLISAAPQQVAPAQATVEVAEATIEDLGRALDDGRVSSVELVDRYLARIEAYDRGGPDLHSVIAINPAAREEAAALDRERAGTGPRGPLHGIPILVKDNYDTAGMPTTGGSMALATNRPPDDAFQVRKLREAGAVILGKTNLHELAMGITTVASLGGQTRNPYDPRRNPGGSSGGTAAAVAASFAAAGMGSDTCGSIRIPSSHNNLVGLRGTAGLSSRDGIIPLSHTQDIGGPLARTVTDLAIVLDATVGPDPNDPITETAAGRLPSTFVAGLKPDALKGARIGILTTLFGTAGDETAVSDVVRAALADLAALGVETPEVEIADFEDLMKDSGVIEHEFKFDLIDYLTGSEGAGVSSLDDILTGGLLHQALEGPFRRRNEATDRDSEAYRAALSRRDVIRGTIETLLTEQNLDALAYPSIRRIPALVGEPQFGSNCALSAQSGLPAMALPAGFTADGIPVGFELLGRSFSDVELVGLAYAFEQALPKRRAPATTPPLVNGLAPAPVTFDATTTPSAPGDSTGATVRLTFDVVRSQLAYQVRLDGVEANEVLGAYLHRGAEGSNGPMLHRLLDAGRLTADGVVNLTPRDAAEVADGEIYLQLYSAAHPAGAARAQIVPASR